MANRNDKINSVWKQTIWFHYVGRSVLFSQACMIKHLFYKVKVLKHSSWLIKKQNGTQNSISTFWPSSLYNFFVPMAGWKPYAISIFLEIIKNVWIFTRICFEEIVLKIHFFFNSSG